MIAHVPKSQTIAVLGAGSWGTALANLLAKNGVNVKLWDRNKARVDEINDQHQNSYYLPGIDLWPTIRAYHGLADCVEETQYILICIPSHAFLPLLKALQPLIKEQGLCWATKGLDPDSGQFLHQIIERELGLAQYGILSGPSFAKEVAKGLPTAVVIASSRESFATSLAQLFHSDCFRVYTTQDLIGVQLGGVVKNILAVAVGISDGLELGANARAALMTRGLAEMRRLGNALKANQETLMGLAGCGDVILTCTDNQSRNRRFGLALGQGFSETEALQKIGQVVEAVYNVKQLCHLAKKQGVELPISEQVFRVMKQEVSPREAVTALLARAIKKE